MSVRPELKPCPFCGAKMEERRQTFAYPDPEPDLEMDQKCPVAGLGFAWEEAERWNVRAPAALSSTPEKKEGEHG